MTVPSANTFTMPAAEALSAAGDSDPYTLRLRQFQLARPLIENLANGGTVVVELDEWLNKSSGRAAVLLTALDEDDVVVAHHEWPWILLPMADYTVELPRMFPWATLTSDNEEADHELYETEYGMWDSEDGRYIGFSETFDERRRGRFPEGIRPASDDGEVAHWHLSLELSDVGRAFLVLDEALTNEITHDLFD
jgi:hypothetical protein